MRIFGSLSDTRRKQDAHNVRFLSSRKVLCLLPASQQEKGSGEYGRSAKSRFVFVILIVLFALFARVPITHAASLSLGPSSGSFTVGSTFDVSIFLDTEKEYVNVIDILLQFPPDKLQLVSPATGPSIIEIWTSQPRFNNQTGTIELMGGIPRGVSVSDGLITKLTFRVKSTGPAVVKFFGDSRVLLNDGLGTDALQRVQNAVYQLILPPPAGPIVVSETHPDQAKWYSNSTVVLTWASEEDVDSYSYILNQEPVDIPDDTSEGKRTGIAYKSLPSKTHYFHIKSLKDGRWGGTSHFAIRIDAVPPAEFSIEIKPSSKTTERHPVLQFFTTDNLSGLDHYELKIVSLSLQHNLDDRQEDQPLFIEVESLYIVSELALGAYDVIVRSYDKAGNYREAIERLKIVTPLFQFVEGRGIRIKDTIFIPWMWILIMLGILLLLFGFAAWGVRHTHHHVEEQRRKREIPPRVKDQLEELKKYRERYGKMLILLLIWSSLLVSSQSVFAQGVEIGPPIITTVSRNIANDEIFYVGGKTEVPGAKIIIYLQNLQTGETLSQTVESDNRGDWLYLHETFLSSGDYIVWTQGRILDQLSPPGPQVQLRVQPTAIQFGASRISYEILYLMVSIVLFLALIGLIVYIAFHGYHARKKHKQFVKEISEVEEAVRRGFAVLRRDIEAELGVIKKVKLSRELAIEEKLKEEQLLRDFKSIEERIGKEIWDVEELERNG